MQVIVKQMGLVEDASAIRGWCKKMAPPLVTLLSAEPEVQYVALRNINLIVQKFPEVLTSDVKVDSLSHSQNEISHIDCISGVFL